MRLPGLDLVVRFEAGELLATEVSCKYTRASTTRLLEQAGLRPEQWLTDETRRFALALASR